MDLSSATPYIVTLFVLVFAELTKSLSANGTPPLLQKLTWQIDLAHFMWSWIMTIRIVLFILLAYLAFSVSDENINRVVIATAILMPIWAVIFYIFNYVWIGKYKFFPITQKVFANQADNTVDKSVQVLGVNHNGEQKAFPLNIIAYHHQVGDDIGGQAMLVAYCAMCRSGRVYDANVSGQRMDFALVGAINFNAVLKDSGTGSWWRQETGECAKGPLKGEVLEDIAFEQMSLEDWFAKYPDSKVLQYDPKFQQKYDFWTHWFNYEASFPRWFMQEIPPLVVGVVADDHHRGYDWEELRKNKLVMDKLGSTELLLMASKSGATALVFDRNVEGEKLDFSLEDDVLKDIQTGSVWDQFGRCTEGSMQGKELIQIQCYQQFVRSWITFHPTSDFYDFT